jgi:hypothetical protein
MGGTAQLTEPLPPSPYWTRQAPGPVAPPPPPKPPRERSQLAALTLSGAVLVAGVVVLLGLVNNGWTRLDTQAVLASVTIVIGAGLVAGAWYGRSRALIWLGALVALMLALTTAYDGPLDAGAGQRLWAPTSVSAVDSPYELGVGSAELDLTGLDPDGTTVDVDASVGIGELVVRVPESVDLRIDSHVGVGVSYLPDESPFTNEENGVDVDRSTTVSGDPTAGSQRGTIVLDVKVGIGDLEVRREAA